MPTYDTPSGYSKRTKEYDDERRKLRNEIDDGTKAQQINKIFGRFTPKQRAEVKAIDKLLNTKESQAEALEQRIADEYPKGTKVFGRQSRNKAEYGKPKEYKSGGVVKGCGQAKKGTRKARMY